ncbi:hypothetical protein [Streptomyces sp. NPDC002602]|uniref:hypothetical protein n=1 Tax=Streptomyces sp. NPDC002602 TaxID=3364654 RepID=UPI0036A08835
MPSTRYPNVARAYGDDQGGATIKFATKREAKRAADEAEIGFRRGDVRDPSLGQETFGEYASRWYDAQDLAASTM